MGPWCSAILALLSNPWPLAFANQQRLLEGSLRPTWLPTLKIHLTPLFYDDETAAHLDVQMDVQSDVILAGQPILQHRFSIGTAPMVEYDSSSLHFTSATCKDDQVYTQDVENPSRRQWFCTEDLVGNYTVQFVAKPRIGNESEPCGPPAALERDDDGIIGSGFAFLPELISDADWNMTVGWDLRAAPEAVRAVSSFGDGTVSSVVGTPFLISNSVFAVGRLRSFPNHSMSSNYAMYWFGEPTFNATDLALRAGSFYTQAAKIFNDENAPFRIFLKRAVNRCSSGEAFYQSFTMMWTPLTKTSSEEYFDIMAHEIIHNWPLLQSNGPKSGTKVDADAWWSEGIATYLSTVLTYRFGIYDEEHYVQQMNEEVYTYYTSPAVNAAYQELEANFWSDYRMQKMVYQRGFMYYVFLAARLRQQGTSSLDKLIGEMVRRRLSGRESYNITTWLSLVASEVGTDVALKDYHVLMLNATSLIVPPRLNSLPDTLENTYVLERHDEEAFYLGFPESIIRSETPKVIHDLDPQSRAHVQGGVMNGDEIIMEETTSVNDAVKPGVEMIMKVKRKLPTTERGVEEGKSKEYQEWKLRWLPRTWEKVECWQWVRSAAIIDMGKDHSLDQIVIS